MNQYDPVRFEMAKQDLNEASTIILKALADHYGQELPSIQIISAMGYLATKMIILYEERTGVDMMTNFMKTMETSYHRMKE